MPNNIAPMPTQNPWAWALMGVGAQCWSMVITNNFNLVREESQSVGTQPKKSLNLKQKSKLRMLMVLICPLPTQH